MPLNISGSVVNAATVGTLDTKGIIERGLVCHLDADSLDSYQRGNRTSYDISSKSNYGQVNNGVALTFDGSDDYISMTQVSHPTNCTLMVWIKTSTANKSICSHYDGNPVNMNYNINSSGYLEYQYYDGSWRTIDSNPVTVTDGNWHHIVFARSGTNHKMYKDGALIDEGTLNSQMGGAIASIGRNWSGKYFNGLMSDFRIYSTQLSAADISEIYNSPNTILPGNITSSQLFQWLPLTEGSGTSAYDSSGNNRHGTLTNMAPTWTTGQPDIPQLAGKGHSRKAVFDGSDDYVTNGSYVTWDVADTWTVSFWMYMTSTGLQTFFSMQESSPGNNGLEIITNNTIREIFINNLDGGGQYNQCDTNNSAWSTSTWTHVAVTNNGATNDGSSLGSVYAIYINGVSQSINSLGGSVGTVMANTSRKLTIGQQVVGGRYVGGIMDEVAIWNSTLDAAAVTAIYNSGVPIDLRNNSSNYDEYTDNLKGYWRNDGTGTWQDLSGNGNHGTVNGSPSKVSFPEGTTSKKDSQGFPSEISSFGFDGSNDYITCGNDSSLQVAGNITAAAWVYRDTQGAYSGIVEKMSGSSYNGWMFRWDSSNNLEFMIAIDSTFYGESSGVCGIGAWHHVVGTNDGTNLKVYVDGSLSATTASGGAIVDSGTDLQIGNYAYGNGSLYPLNGKVSDVQIYNRALSAKEILHNFNVQRDRFGV